MPVDKNIEDGAGATRLHSQPMKKFASYILGLTLALLIVAPVIDYTIPVMINSFHWCYLVIASGLLGMLFMSFSVSLPIKILPMYLFAGCFFSQAPYLSFNAYILVVFALYLFLLVRACDFKIVASFLAAAFWLEVILAVFQLMGRDKLMNFDRPEPVFMGTVMQYMRFASVLAVMAPFLILKNRLYVIPIVLMCVISRSSTFAVSLLAGALVYLFLKMKTWRNRVMAASVCTVCLVAYALYDYGSFEGAIAPSNGGRLISWWVILRTWVLDTANEVYPFTFSGPFRWDWFLFGHGMDTFLPLFPVYKHDANPFPQAHNCWLQFLWEIGLVGFSLIAAYCAILSRKLLQGKHLGLVAGLACIGTDMFFSFPTRMTQTMFLIVSYAAFCEIALRGKSHAKDRAELLGSQTVLQDQTEP